ncbi:putative protein tag-278 isoform X2 [Amia ocellicauda]|uniref:putative protein tag-278 isoform X2 n=1 Tax=Amia ocellicauda TaxID=2972642 RepID=UPI003463DA30
MASWGADIDWANPALSSLFPDLTTQSLLSWQYKLRLQHSESRRQALEESLANTHNALRHLSDKLHRPAPLIELATEDLVTQQKMLAMKIEHIKALKPYSHATVMIDVLKDNDLHRRVQQTQSELGIISCKLDQVINRKEMCCTSIVLSPKPEIPVFEKKQVSIDPDVLGENLQRTSKLIAFSLENNELLKEKCHLEQSVQRLSAHLKMTESSKEKLESQVSKLHSELFQARCQEHRLEKVKLQTESELTGSRQVNENMLHELTLVRHKMTLCEEQVTRLESERNISTVKIKALESERQQLISQKELLLQILKKSKSPQGVIEVSCCGLKRSAVDVEAKACVDCEKVGRELRDVKVQLSLLQEERRAVGPADTAATPPLPQPAELQQEEVGDKTRKLLEVCEEQKKSIEDLTILRQKLELSLEKFNRRIMGIADWEEMIRILKVQKEFLSQMASSQLSLKQMVLEGSGLKWKRHSGTQVDDPEIPEEKHSCSPVQITALIIELKHLRKAYKAMTQGSQSPEDIEAINWIHRSRLIKNCIDAIQSNDTKLASLRGENRRIQEAILEEQLDAMRAEVMALQDALHSKNKSITAVSLLTSLLERKNEDLQHECFLPLS